MHSPWYFVENIGPKWRMIHLHRRMNEMNGNVLLISSRKQSHISKKKSKMTAFRRKYALLYTHFYTSQANGYELRWIVWPWTSIFTKTTPFNKLYCHVLVLHSISNPSLSFVHCCMASKFTLCRCNKAQSFIWVFKFHSLNSKPTNNAVISVHSPILRSSAYYTPPPFN